MYVMQERERERAFCRMIHIDKEYMSILIQIEFFRAMEKVDIEHEAKTKLLNKSILKTKHKTQ